MKLCSEGHSQIAYEVRDCPLCDASIELDKYLREIDSYRQLESRISDFILQQRDNQQPSDPCGLQEIKSVSPLEKSIILAGGQPS